MIVFLSLFLGLVTGVQMVELAVEPPVVRVELYLGDRLVGSLDSAPWRIRCDLGSKLHPAELAAVGYDSDGRQVIRVVQRLNVPDQRAAIAVVPVFAEDRRVVGARVSWESPEFGKPTSIDAQVDDQRRKVARDGSIELADLDPERVHVLTVDVEFPDGVGLRRELVFGAGHSGETSRALTAVPVRMLGAVEPTLEELAGAFVARGEPVDVVAFEEPQAQLIVIRDRGVEARIDELVEDRDDRESRRRRSTRGEDRIAPDGFDEEVLVRMMAPTVTLAGRPGRQALLFPLSDPKKTHRKGLLEVLATHRYGKGAMGGRRIADALAVAGMRSAAGNLRRAVIVALGPEDEDLSVHAPVSVRAYLGDLGVPLFLWDLGASDHTLARWSPEPLASFRSVRGAVRLVRDELAAQRIVWVEGSFLPQEVSLSPELTSLELVGAGR